MPRVFILISWLFVIGCAQPQDLLYQQINIQSSDAIYDIVIDKTTNRIYAYPGYVWSRCTEVTLNSEFVTISKDTISDKALFDIYIDTKGTHLGVGTDGYLYTKARTEQKWNFHRLSNWDILHKIVEKPNGYIAAGGKAYETGYIYHINPQYTIDSVQYFGHEISDIINITGDIWLTVGWGNIQRSVDGGRSWIILDIEGDLFLSTVFVDEKHGWVVGANGSLLESLDAGLTWTKSKAVIRGNGFDSFAKITVIDDRRLVILGTNGRLWLSYDGTRWQEMELDTSSDLIGIVSIGSGKFIVHGTNGFIAEISL